jgi:hypothetical protein
LADAKVSYAHPEFVASIQKLIDAVKIGALTRAAAFMKQSILLEIIAEDVSRMRLIDFRNALISHRFWYCLLRCNYSWKHSGNYTWNNCEDY